MNSAENVSADRDRLIHILVVHFNMFRHKAEDAADLFLHDKTLVTPAAAFSTWLNEGPKLAKAAGLYVGIQVTALSEGESAK